MPNYLLRLSFVGTNYHGWQIQKEVPTVQGKLTEALRRISGEEVKLTGCCRTDAGVHALDYVANFKTKRDLDHIDLLKALNALTPRDIGIKEVRKVEDSFNARFSIEGKVYLYRILTLPYRDPFEYPYVWHIPREIDFELIRKSSKKLSGNHDFSGFAKLEEEKQTKIDLEITPEKEGNLILIRFRSRHFLRYMVRRLTACIVMVATGKMELSRIDSFLKGESFPFKAPARGLFLERVIL